MRLRTNHGTYVVAREDGELVHLAQPLDHRFQSVWSGAAPPILEPGAVTTALNDGLLAPATLVALGDGLVALRRDGLYLCADPTFPEVRFDRAQVGPWERFAIEAPDGALVVYPQAERSRGPNPASKPMLIETLAGYQIVSDAPGSDIVTVTWPEYAEEPINRYTLRDGCWIVDVDRVNDLDKPFLVYWFYPFSDKMHAWRLDQSGRRIFGYDLSHIEAFTFLSRRRALGPAITARLYMLSQKCGDQDALARLGQELYSAAEAGSDEALYAVLCNPIAFSSDVVRSLAERAFRLVHAANRARADLLDSHLRPIAVEAFVKALIVLDPALRDASQEQLQGELDFSYTFIDPRRFPMSGEALPFSLHRHSADGLASRLGGIASIEMVGVLLRTDSKSIEFHYINTDGGRRIRILDGIRYAHYVLSTHHATIWDVLVARGSPCRAWMIRFEVGDLPATGEPSAAFERLVGDTKVTLLPDLYYFKSHGFRYGWFEGDIQPWDSKENRFVWRGSTTGAYDLTRETVAQAPRVRLCEVGRSIGSVADFGITDVVHARSDVDAEDIKLFLKDNGLWRDRMPQHIMGGAKFLIEIDGNANSWGFLAKLLMGCCILKVDSPYEQWFYDRIQPWVHYVPVANDLSDLSDKVEWCLHNEEACREIAEAGLRLARSLSFDTQVAAAAQAFLSVAAAAD